MEVFDIVDIDDNIFSSASRSEVHGNPDLIHRVAHVIVMNSDGEIFLQKRSLSKDVQPGKWDTSVGGHLDQGESYEQAAHRELWEELGVRSASLQFLYKYLHRNSYESEYVSTFLCYWKGPFVLQESEIDDGRFWSADEISKQRNNDIFTPNFLDEWDRFCSIEKKSVPENESC